MHPLNPLAEDSMLYNGSCYIFNSMELNYDDATIFCESKYSHLVYIGTENEQEFIENTIKSIKQNLDYWIGLTVIGNTSVPIWLDNSSLSYNKLHEQHAFDEMSKCFRIKHGSYKWHDNDCNEEHGSICEREIGKLTIYHLITGWYNKNGTTYFPQCVDTITSISGWGIFSWEEWYHCKISNCCY